MLLIDMQNFRIIPLIQTIYYTITAVWPLLHIQSFMDVTGEKTDVWLVKTVSLLLLPYCFLLLYLTVNYKRNFIIVIAIMICCLGLAAVEGYYYFRKVIKWVYLVDAIIQMIFFGYWIHHIKINSKVK